MVEEHAKYDWTRFERVVESKQDGIEAHARYDWTSGEDGGV
jgi:hypothetical protein